MDLKLMGKENKEEKEKQNLNEISEEHFRKIWNKMILDFSMKE
jgi:hypothetical protein